MRLSGANKWHQKYQNVKKVSQKKGRLEMLYLGLNAHSLRLTRLRVKTYKGTQRDMRFS